MIPIECCLFYLMVKYFPIWIRDSMLRTATIAKNPEIKIYCDPSLSIQKNRASDLSNQSLPNPWYLLISCGDISIGKPSFVIKNSTDFGKKIVLQLWDSTKGSEVNDVKWQEEYYSKHRMTNKHSDCRVRSKRNVLKRLNKTVNRGQFSESRQNGRWSFLPKITVSEDDFLLKSGLR
jgi:hypothetical protein